MELAHFLHFCLPEGHPYSPPLVRDVHKCVCESLFMFSIRISLPQSPMNLLCLPESATPLEVVFSIKVWEEKNLVPLRFPKLTLKPSERQKEKYL